MEDSLLITVTNSRGFSIFALLTVFSIMFGVGLRLPLNSLSPLIERPGLLIRSLIGVILLVPLSLLVLSPLAILLHLPKPVAIGLILLAACPGAPLLTKRSLMAGGNFEYSANLQLISAVISVWSTPVTLWAFAQFFPRTEQIVGVLDILKQVAIIQLFPIFLGLSIRTLWPSIADRIIDWVIKIADIFFVILILLVLLVSVPAIADIGLVSILIILIFAVSCIGIGHLLGGPELEFKAALAIASVARNIGLSLTIATLNSHSFVILPTLVGFAILGGIVAIPYSLWMKGKIAKESSLLL